MTKIVAIDGPSGSGKSSVAKILADEIGYSYIDTGGMYRTITYFLLKNNIDINNIDSINKVIDDFKIDYKNNNYYLNDKLLNDELRTKEINNNVSVVASHKIIRDKAVSIQRELSKSYNTILDGRDIATAVFPNADYKFYLDASAEIRAKRRFDQKQDTTQSYEEILNDIIKRDEFDKNRVESPLVIADDAIYIDTSNMDIKEVINTLKNNIN